MTWTLVGVGSPIDVASGSVTAALPAGTQAGDLLIADIGYRDAPAFSVPSGWTLVAQINDPFDTRTDAYADAGVAQAYCVRGASAPDLTFARTLGNAAIVQVRAYRVSGAVSLDTHVTHNVTNRIPSHAIGALTTGADNALIVATIPQARIGDSITGLNAVDPGTGTDGTPDIVSAPGSAWRTRFNSGTTLGSDVRLYGFDAVKAAAGSTGTITWTQTGVVSGKAVVSSFSYAAGGGVSITAITASNITASGATITVARSNPAAGTLHLALYPVGITPTWSIGSGWSDTPVYTDADTDPGTGTSYQFGPDASGLPSGTQLVPWAVWYNGTTTVGPMQGTTFETAVGTSPISADVVVSYSVRTASVQSAPITYTIQNAISSDVHCASLINNLVSQDRLIQYLTNGEVSQQQTVPYSVNTGINSSVTTTYITRGVVLNTLGPTYTVLEQILSENTSSYNVVGVVASSNEVVYAISGAISAIFSEAVVEYLVSQSIGNDNTSQYFVNLGTSQDIQVTYQAATNIQSGKVINYEILSASSVTSVTTTEYAIAESVVTDKTALYSITLQVTSDSITTFNTQTTVLTATSTGYVVRDSVSDNYLSVYGVKGYVSSPIALSYTVLSEFQPVYNSASINYTIDYFVISALSLLYTVQAQSLSHFTRVVVIKPPEQKFDVLRSSPARYTVRRA